MGPILLKGYLDLFVMSGNPSRGLKSRICIIDDLLNDFLAFPGVIFCAWSTKFFPFEDLVCSFVRTLELVGRLTGLGYNSMFVLINLWRLGEIAATEVTLCFDITLVLDEMADCDAYHWGKGGKSEENCWGSSDAFGFSIVSAASV